MNDLSKEKLWNYILEGYYTFEISNSAGKLPPAAELIFGYSDMTNLINDAEEQARDLPQNEKIQLFCCVGADQNGRAILKDMSLDIRQLLITGVQGSGKSNASTFIILSVLWGNDPEITELHIFDAKSEFPHFSKIAKVYSEYKTIGENIKKLREIMEARYKEMAQLGLKNIKDFNEFRKEKGLKLMPRIVIFIDEYATTSANVSNMNSDLLILSNTGRAAGVYIIIVTQRADRDMLPPAIKANMSSDLAFFQRDIVNAQISGIEEVANLRKTGVAFFRSGVATTQVSFPLISHQNLLKIIKNLEQNKTRIH